MGSRNAQSMVAGVKSGWLGIREMLHWHLMSNHYPPVNVAFVPACLEAMEAYQEGKIGDIIAMPNGKRLTAAAIVTGLHLEAFLDCEEE